MKDSTPENSTIPGDNGSETLNDEKTATLPIQTNEYNTIPSHKRKKDEMTVDVVPSPSAPQWLQEHETQETTEGDPQTTEGSNSNLMPNSNDLAQAIGELVTPDTIHYLTRRTVREGLERKFNLEHDALIAKKEEINGLLEEIIQRMRDETAAAAPKTKRQKVSDDESHEDDSASQNDEVDSDDDDADVDDDDDEKEEEESEGRGRRKSATGGGRRATGLRKAQSSIMTKAFFVENAEVLDSNLGSVKFQAAPREFSTGSCGWFYGSKQEFDVCGKKVVCQLTVNCTVLGSKAWKGGKKKK